MRTTRTIKNMNTNIESGRNAGRATKTIAGLAAVAALALGATACGSDETEPGDDPIEVPDDAPADEPIETDGPADE